MKILMVLISCDKLGNTGRKTGVWLEEFAAPYYTFVDAGVTVTLASPKGGNPPLDPVSDTPEGQTHLPRRINAASSPSQMMYWIMAAMVLIMLFSCMKEPRSWRRTNI